MAHKMPRRFRPRKPTPAKPFEDDESAAYIYALTNPAFHYIKIGFTLRSPKERAKELASATGVPGDFEVNRDWFVPSDQVRIIESEIHSELRKLGFHHKKEFFDVSIFNAIKIIENVLQKHGLLDLANAKEEIRLNKLRTYYAKKKEKARQQKEEIERQRNQLIIKSKIESTAREFRLKLHEHLKEKHKFRTIYLPVCISCLIFCLSIILSSAIIEGQWIWKLLMVFIVTNYFFGHFRDKASDYISENYKLLIEQRTSLVVNFLSANNKEIDQFLSSEKCRSLLV